MRESDQAQLEESAVLVPVFRDRDGEVGVVLVRRTDWGAHGGQIAFPGGMRAAEDRSLFDTALREAHEEIGLERACARLLEEPPPVDTLSTGFRIHPFLAAIRLPSSWRIQTREIAEVLEVKVASLLDPKAHGEEEWSLPGWLAPRRISFFRVGEHKVWGATYRILRPLAPRLLSEDWAI